MTWQLLIPRHPSLQLAPGRRQHWSVTRRAKAEDTQLAFWLTRQAGLGVAMPWGCCDLTIRFMVTVARRRDRDNWLGRCKGFLDGLTQAGVWTADNADVIRSISLEFVKEKGVQPSTIFIIENRA